MEFPDFDLSIDDPEAPLILETIKMYFECSVNSNVDLFLEISHPKLTRLALGNSNELYWMTQEEVITQSLEGLANARKNVPNFQCRFRINKLIHFTIHDVIASIAVDWTMLMTESTGHHCTCFHLAKHEDNWIIAHVIDRGRESLKGS